MVSLRGLWIFLLKLVPIYTSTGHERESAQGHPVAAHLFFFYGCAHGPLEPGEMAYMFLSHCLKGQVEVKAVCQPDTPPHAQIP
jgi:hypothetical protein